MNIAVIGGGASGIYYSLLRKRNHPEDKITIFEKEERIGRKILATGNGHCNLLNKNLAPEMFNDRAFMERCLSRYSISDLENVFWSWGIPLMEKDGLVYPLSFSAKNFLNQLLSLLEKEQIACKTSAKVGDYKRNQGKFYIGNDGPFDRIVISTGGCSSPKLGSDGSLISSIKNHGHNVIPMKPGLCPIKVKEKGLKSISGIRHHAEVRLLVNNNEVYKESGEVLFKDDGLSGIVIFNTELQLVRHHSGKPASILVDLFPEYSESKLVSMLKQAKENNREYLLGFIPKELVSFLAPGQTKDLQWWAHKLKSLAFTVDSVYGFDSSQVSTGGVDSTQLTSSLESEVEHGVYFIGEVVNIDGICGGFNLSWALLSAMIAAE